MAKPKLVLSGDEGNSAEGQKIIFDVSEGTIRMRKFCGECKEVIDWSGFSIEESKLIHDFFGKAIKVLKK